VYTYLDNEVDDRSYGQIRQHLDECAPCLREYGLEEVVKKLVHKSCGQEPVPGELRTKVMTRIAVVRSEIESGELTEVTQVTQITEIQGE
jgi:mycothiol system anti-sigma-R factor